MKLWDILVPVCDPGGSPISDYEASRWDDQVRDLCGGLTSLGETTGHWVSPSGDIIIEPMRLVRVSCNKETIEKIADLTADSFNQQAVMYYLVSNKVFIKNYAVA